MNLDHNLILLKDKDKTSDIRICEYANGKYHIVFWNNPQDYFYSYLSVKWLRNPVLRNTENYRFLYKGQLLFDIKKIQQFDDYIRIFFKDDRSKTYHKQDLKIEHNNLAEEDSRNCLNYFKNVASSTGIRSEDGQSLLNSQFEKLTFINADTALAAYLSRRVFERISYDSEGFYYPFGHNLSQISAIKTALGNQISVIEGPPGTGKTQTILNIIANLVIRGLTVAVVSNNNSATVNVLEKLEQYGFNFFAAPLGRAENKKTFIENQSGLYPDLSSFQYNDQEVRQIRQSISRLEHDSQEVLRYKNEIADFRKSLSELEVEKQYFVEYFHDLNGDLVKPHLNQKVRSSQILRLSTECQYAEKQNKQIGTLLKLKCWLIVNMKWRWLKEKTIDELILAFQYLFYIRKAEEIERSIQELENKLKQLQYDERMANLKQQSLIILKDSLFQKYQGKRTRRIFSDVDLWKQAREFNHEYPVILSTTHSIRNCLNQEHIYDYVIVDEASQVDLMTGVLALSCAKNAVIVGDLMQLPNVINEATKQTANSIFSQYNLVSGYNYSEHSLLSSVCALLPAVPRTLLREHYRCHPKIIGFCNQKFYDNQLIVMTQDDLRDDVLKIHKTVPGSHARERINQRQIDEIMKEILPELSCLVGHENIGIIAPYRAQVGALQNSGESADIDISTVHKFQGREKDAIIITTVDNVISEFTDNPNLLNVAISRAKNFLRLVISDSENNDKKNLGDLVRYIQYNNFETIEGSVYSVFDMLYKEYATARQKFLKSRKRISEFESENLMQALIEDVLKTDEFCQYDVVSHFPLKMIIRNREILSPEELAYVMHHATHTDFLIYRKLDKRPILVVEVDGYAFHREGSIQGKRDAMKNAILDISGLPYLRFKTNGSQEKDILIERLSQI